MEKVSAVGACLACWWDSEKATEEWREEVRTTCCFNIMIETEQNMNNKSISHSFGNKEITVASRFAVWPMLGLCSLGCECCVLMTEGQQAKESLADSSHPFYKGVSQSRG